jgi:hypothetical protein
VPEPSCTTRKPVKFAVVLRGHLPNITLCTTRNSHSCYGLKVPRRRPNPLRLFSHLTRRRPDPLRLFSHFSRIRVPGVCGKPQLKQRPGRSRRSGGPAIGPPGRGTMGGISSPSGWTRRQPCEKRVPEKLRDYRVAGLDSGNCLLTGFRMPPAVNSGFQGESIAAAGADRIRASRSKGNG